MARFQASIKNFNGGLLGVDLASRTDLDIYSRGCKTLKNMLPIIQGGATRRLGSKFINTEKFPLLNTRLIPFKFSQIDSYTLEFGDKYIRFYTLRNQVKVGGNPFEIVTPYLESEIADLKFVQIGDIVYFAHPNHLTRKLTRRGATDWTLEEIDNKFGVVVDRDIDEDVTMEIISGDGTILDTNVTIEASGAAFGTDDLGFQTKHEGSVWAFGEASDSLSPYAEWTQGGSASVGTYIRFEGRLYKVISGTTFGNIQPQHEFGTVSDGSVELKFINFGTGFARMVTRNSATEAIFKIQKSLPPTLVAGSIFAATTFWNEASWSDVRGFPRAIAFHEQRLFLASTLRDPLHIWGSRSNRRFEDFDPSIGEDDAAITYEMSAELNNIQWLKSDNNFILAATAAGVGFIGSGEGDKPITPSQVKARTGAGFGASSVQPVTLYNSVQYIQRQGTKINRLTYSDINLNYASEDISQNNPDILTSGVKELGVMEEKDVILWIVTNDGRLISFNIDVPQKIAAFSEHSLGSGVLTKSVAVIPAKGNDEVWLLTDRGIEYLEPNEKLYLVDAGVEQDNVQVVTGLGHLDGQEIFVVADGDVQTHIVANGAVTLSKVFTKVFAGLGYVSDLEPMRIEAGTQAGDPQGVYSRIHEIVFRIFATGKFKYGRNFDNLKNLPFDRGEDDPSKAFDLFATDYPTDVTATWNGSDRVANISIRQDLPLPLNILSLNPRMRTNEK